MNEAVLLDQTFKRWEMLLAAWNFYLVVAIGIITLFAQSKSVREDRRNFWIFLIGFEGFAFCHFLGLMYIIKSWAALAAEMHNLIKSPEAIERFANSGIIDAPEPIWIIPFHLIGDTFVATALWWLCRRRGG
jgi:hypothetical protein